MSNYYDPSWYEQQDQQKTNQSPPEDPVFGSFSEYPALPQQNYTGPVPQPTIIQPPTRNTKNRRGRLFGRIVVVLLLLVIAFTGGWFSQPTPNTPNTPGNQSSSYSKLYQQAWNIVDQNYVDRKAINYKQMSYKSIQAMLDVLNDKGHTRFLTPADVQSENQQLSGKFTGIGVYLRQDPTTKQLIITSTIPGSPAEKAGFKHGDVIVAVNGVSTVGKDIAFASNLIRGEAGTSVAVTIQRATSSQPITINVTRAEINVQNVIMHYIAEDHIAHIQVVQFADGVAAQLKDAVNQAKSLGAKSIILDLRDNPGGYLSQAIDTASLFVKSGNVLLEQDSTGQRTPYAVNGNPIEPTTQMEVLIVGCVWVVVEIVSGALHDNNRAILLGEKTFGTGTVLRQFPLSDGSAILLGISEWLTPKGQFIRDQGIPPDVAVSLKTNAVALSPNDENVDTMTKQQILSSSDDQLIAAIQYLETHATSANTPALVAQQKPNPNAADKLAIEPQLWAQSL